MGVFESVIGVRVRVRAGFILVARVTAVRVVVRSESQQLAVHDYG